MTAPLCDSRGKIRYFIGAQVDVSGLVKDCTDLDSLERLLERQQTNESVFVEMNGDVEQNGKGVHTNGDSHQMPVPVDRSYDPLRVMTEEKDELRALSEMLNMAELTTVRKHGGRMHTDRSIDDADSISSAHKPRLLLREPSPDHVIRSVPSFDSMTVQPMAGGPRLSGKLSGVYKHVS